MSRRSRLSAPEALGVIIVRGDTVRTPIALDGPPVAPRDWELAVGTKIARRARPTKLERGVLHVRTASSAWTQELSLLADTIAAQLRARGLDVRSLRFQVGPVEPLKRPSWRTDERLAPGPAALPAVVSASIAEVEDTELRAAIARAAAASLGYEPVKAKAPPAKRAAPRSKATADPPRSKAPAAGDEGSKARSTSPRSAAPDPRSAAARSARPDRTTPEPPAAPRGKRGATSARGS